MSTSLYHSIPLLKPFQYPWTHPLLVHSNSPKKYVFWNILGILYLIIGILYSDYQLLKRSLVLFGGNKCITYLAPTKIKGTRLCLPLYHGKHSLVPFICMHSKLLIPFYYRTLTIEKNIMGLYMLICMWRWWTNTTHHRRRCCLRCCRYCSCGLTVQANIRLHNVAQWGRSQRVGSRAIAREQMFCRRTSDSRWC